MKNRILINLALALIFLSGVAQLEDPILGPDDQRAERLRSAVSMQHIYTIDS